MSPRSTRRMRPAQPCMLPNRRTFLITGLTKVLLLGLCNLRLSLDLLSWFCYPGDQGDGLRFNSSSHLDALGACYVAACLSSGWTATTPRPQQASRRGLSGHTQGLARRCRPARGSPWRPRTPGNGRFAAPLAGRASPIDASPIWSLLARVTPRLQLPADASHRSTLAHFRQRSSPDALISAAGRDTNPGLLPE